MNIKDLIKISHDSATNKGFFDRDVEVNDMLIQIVSEIGELYEAVRRGESVDRISEEISDIVISWASCAGYLEKQYGMDIEIEVMRKIAINEGRAYKNGKLY